MKNILTLLTHSYLKLSATAMPYYHDFWHALNINKLKALSLKKINTYINLGAIRSKNDKNLTLLHNINDKIYLSVCQVYRYKKWPYLVMA